MRGLLIIFGPSTYDDPMKTLTKLRQVGSVEVYKVEFEVVSSRLEKLSDNHKLSFFFINGLKDEIRLPVKMFNPPDLLTAFSLAKIQEEHVRINKRGF